MRKIIKARWAIFSIWLIVTILLTAFQPDINAILRNKGQQALSKDSCSVVANSILKKMKPVKGTDDIIMKIVRPTIHNNYKFFSPIM